MEELLGINCVKGGKKEKWHALSESLCLSTGGRRGGSIGGGGGVVDPHSDAACPLSCHAK